MDTALWGFLAMLALVGLLGGIWFYLSSLSRAATREETKRLKEQLALDPSNTELHWRLAESQMESGEFWEASETARKAIGLNPDDPIAHELAALAYAAMGSHAKAEEHAERALELEPDSFRAYLALATVSESAGETAKANELRKIAFSKMFRKQSDLEEEEKADGGEKSSDGD